jgi:cardiolipin synthase
MALGRGRVVLAASVLLVIIIAVGLWIAQDQETVQLGSPYSADDPRAPDYVSALVAADLSMGNSYVVLTNGDQTFAAMLDAIERATRRISFETYIYEEGEIGRRFTTALTAAARRGVQVRLTIDSIGARFIAQETIEHLQKAGCIVAQFNPAAWYQVEEVNYRTHRKILVVDGETGFTGGIGVADYWMGNAQDHEHWRDTQVMIRGPVVRLLEAAFYENFAEEAGFVTPVLDEPPIDFTKSGQSVVVRSSPSGGSSDLKRLYLLALAMARRSVDIASPYFVTDASTRWALQDATMRGVRVRILVEGDVTDAKPVKYASRHAYDWLLALGVEIFEYQPTMMHVKVMVVDDIWSMFGSANFDNRSLELNDELNVAVWSADLASRFLRDFEQDLTVSRKLELQSWRQRSLLDKGRERFWSLFGEVF